MGHKVQPQYAAGQHIGKALRRIENEIDVCQENIAYYEKRLFAYHENDLSHHYEDTLRWYENLKTDRLSGSSDAVASGGKGKLRNFMAFCGSFMRGAAVTVIVAVLLAFAHILYLGLDFGLVGMLLLVTLSSGIGLTWMITDCILGQRRLQVEKRSAEMEVDAIEAKMAELAHQYESIIVSNRKRAITLFRKQEQLLRQVESGRIQGESEYEGQKGASIWDGRLV
ncbi:hypothetical protein [Salinicoccus roseus]|uniref:hypothetical protein n=1 Tax=Salinicoccus roseus TaxID=45670 RepID=UPI0023015368|nr:hypothetical protein [Salinicoccus roseus]